MCLLFNKHTADVQIASEDITVYKLLKRNSYGDNTTLLSPFFTKSWKIGKMYELSKNLNSSPARRLDGFDGKDTAAAALSRAFEGADIWRVKEGYHASLTPERLSGLLVGRRMEWVICKATIPKGAEYVTGYTDLIVSNCLRIDGILPPRSDLSIVRNV